MMDVDRRTVLLAAIGLALNQDDRASGRPKESDLLVKADWSAIRDRSC